MSITSVSVDKREWLEIGFSEAAWGVGGAWVTLQNTVLRCDYYFQDKLFREQK